MSVSKFAVLFVCATIENVRSQFVTTVSDPLHSETTEYPNDGATENPNDEAIENSNYGTTVWESLLPETSENPNDETIDNSNYGTTVSEPVHPETTQYPNDGTTVSEPLLFETTEYPNDGTTVLESFPSETTENPNDEAIDNSNYGTTVWELLLSETSESPNDGSTATTHSPDGTTFESRLSETTESPNDGSTTTHRIGVPLVELVDWTSTHSATSESQIETRKKSFLYSATQSVNIVGEGVDSVHMQVSRFQKKWKWIQSKVAWVKEHMPWLRLAEVWVGEHPFAVAIVAAVLVVAAVYFLTRAVWEQVKVMREQGLSKYFTGLLHKCKNAIPCAREQHSRNEIELEPVN